ncbi:MAG: cyclodeaminase/cyclohydrolase family protein [Coriobacteriia bacterium]|nr:cyclodeaminase/cyclohydrolase family protein [Coriobacteriia bacterium]
MALASSAPAPGGGGAAALMGALGSALGNMVSALTAGKPKYADVDEEVRQLIVTANELQERFIEYVAMDEEVFVPLAKAYGLPSTTQEERERKAQVMESCLISCSQVPLDIMRSCAAALEMVERIEVIGTTIAISDAGCAALALKAALLSAELNIRANTMFLKDQTKAEVITAEAESIIEKCVPLADAIHQNVRNRLS